MIPPVGYGTSEMTLFNRKGLEIENKGPAGQV
jgi:hypothetical protein